MSHRRNGITNDSNGDVESQRLLKSKTLQQSDVPFPSYVDFKFPKEEDKSITRFALRPPSFTYNQRVGKMYAISKRRVCGPCWMMTLVTASLVIIIPFSLLHAMKHEIRAETMFLTSCWVGITLSMLFLTACTNPGIYPIMREIPENSNQRWAYCKETVASSSRCDLRDGVFIADVDHFCPWVVRRLQRQICVVSFVLWVPSSHRVLDHVRRYGRCGFALERTCIIIRRCLPPYNVISRPTFHLN